MSNKFKSHFTPIVTLQFPRISVSESYDSMQRKYTVVPETTRGAFWACSFVLNDEQRAEMWSVGRAHYEAMRQQEKLPELGPNDKLFRSEQPYKDPEGNILPGQWIYKATKNCQNANGEQTKAPQVLNGNRQPVTATDFWGGSTGRLKFSMLCTVDPKTGGGGIRMLLDKVQLIDPVYGGGFEEVPNAASNTLATAEAPQTPNYLDAPAPAPAQTTFAPAYQQPTHYQGVTPSPAPAPQSAPDPFGLPPVGASAGTSAPPTPNDLEDEIPF